MRRVSAPLIVCALASACGRVAFDARSDAPPGATSDAVGDGRLGDSQLPDAPPGAITLRFGEGTGADVTGVTADTFISNEAGEPTLNYGATDELRSEQDVDERILLRFDITTIPTSATVFSATLSVLVSEFNPAATWEVRPVLEAWTEGVFDGAPGAANYTQRMVGTNWTTVGAGPPGSAGIVIGTMQPMALGVVTEALPVALVQGWVTTPASNFGLVVFNTNANTARMSSSEHATSNARPALTITFVP